MLYKILHFKPQMWTTNITVISTVVYWLIYEPVRARKDILRERGKCARVEREISSGRGCGGAVVFWNGFVRVEIFTQSNNIGTQRELHNLHIYKILK